MINTVNPAAHLPEVDEEEIPDYAEDQGWKLGRALLESARSKSASFQDTFRKDWQYLMGENHWPVPKNALARRSDERKNRSVRNWTFAACDYKAAVVLAARPRINALPLGQQVDFLSRYRAAKTVQYELDRLDRASHEENAFWDGMACGKGITRVLTVEDPRSGIKKLVLEDVDPSRYYPDPQAYRLDDARWVCYEPDMDMAEIRKAFPFTWNRIKAKGHREEIPIADKTVYQSKTDEEMVTGPGKDFIFTRNGKLFSQTYRVAFIWIRDEEVIEEAESRLLMGERNGYQCAGCGTAFEAPPDAMQIPENGSMPPVVTCPDCGSEAVAQVTLPAVSEQGDMWRRFKYPYGRLIVITNNAILYDGPNGDNVEEIYPFSEYDHYRVNRRYFGYSEVAHMKSAQYMADRNIAMLMDYLLYCVNSPLEYPDEVTQWEDIGNAPNAKIATPPHLIGLARKLPPGGFDLSTFQMSEEIVKRDFDNLNGITPVSVGMLPSSPSSGREVELLQAASATRLGGHLDRFNRYRSRLANIVWQMMWQHYSEARFVPIPNSQGKLETSVISIQSLPRDLRMVVTADPEQQQASELTGQVLNSFVQGGQLPFMPDLMLPASGLPPEYADVVAERMQLFQEEQKQAAMQQAQQMPPGMPPGPQGGPSQ